MTKSKSNPSKAAKCAAKGDKHMAAGRPKKAAAEYRKALAADPSDKELHDKLMKALEGVPGEWGMEEFVESLTLEMKKQELGHPPIRQVHAQLSPEWKQATGLALEIMNLEEAPLVEKKIEELVEMGEIATRALIGLLLRMKMNAAERKE